MTAWKFKCCPRCQGDVFLENDMDSWYEKCLQCSYEYELKTLAEFVGQQETKKTPALTGK